MYEREKFIIKKAINEAGLPMGDYFVAGGACTSVFSNKRINDIDIYFRTEKDLKDMMSGHMSQIDSCQMFIYSMVGETDNAITYKRADSTVQLIRKYFLPPEELIEKFDFTICQCAFDVLKDEFVMGKDFLYDMSKRSLRFTGKTEYPIASLYRMKKFMKRDYNPSALDIISIALSINKLEITTFVDLKKQLDGIDTIMLKDLTDALLDKGDTEYNITEALAFMDAKLDEKYRNEVVGEKETK